MANLTDLDQSVQEVLTAIMGALSVDDVVRQRLEHVTTATHALDHSVSALLSEFAKGTFSPVVATTVRNDLAQKMYKSFTMEDEKQVFKSILGDFSAYK
jgi:regulator of protease activity HflC (stomatin/prohibitin superfamily)